jgi:hypothetical protein
MPGHHNLSSALLRHKLLAFVGCCMTVISGGNARPYTLHLVSTSIPKLKSLLHCLVLKRGRRQAKRQAKEIIWGGGHACVLGQSVVLQDWLAHKTSSCHATTDNITSVCSLQHPVAHQAMQPPVSIKVCVCRVFSANTIVKDADGNNVRSCVEAGEKRGHPLK